MVVAIAILVTVPYYIFATLGVSFIPATLYPYLWLIGALAPFTLLIQFLAILIAAGAMSEEYESGTAELLLAKPVSRAEFFLGKFLGGYALLALLILLDAALSVVAATLTFGGQAALETVPGVIFVEIYSSALFFSVAFMLGELLRRSSLAYILSSATILASQIIGQYLLFAFELTGNTYYEMIHIYLPTTLAGSLPPQFEKAFLPSSTSRLFSLILGPPGGTPTTTTSVIFVAVYLVIATSVAFGYFRWADVARRVS